MRRVAHRWHPWRHPWRHTIRCAIGIIWWIAIGIEGHHLARGHWRHRVAVSSAASVSVATLEIPIARATTGWRGSEWVGSWRRKRILRISIWILGTCERHYSVGRRWRCTSEGIVRIRHCAWGISARRSLMGYMRPLGTWVVRRRPRAGRVGARVVVVVFQAGMHRLGPRPPSPMSLLQRVSAPGAVPRRRVVDGDVVA
jgi:hypothetical protein